MQRSAVFVLNSLTFHVSALNACLAKTFPQQDSDKGKGMYWKQHFVLLTNRFMTVYISRLTNFCKYENISHQNLHEVDCPSVESDIQRTTKHVLSNISCVHISPSRRGMHFVKRPSRSLDQPFAHEIRFQNHTKFYGLLSPSLADTKSENLDVLCTSWRNHFNTSTRYHLHLNLYFMFSYQQFVSATTSTWFRHKIWE